MNGMASEVRARAAVVYLQRLGILRVEAGKGIGCGEAAHGKVSQRYFLEQVTKSRSQGKSRQRVQP